MVLALRSTLQREHSEWGESYGVGDERLNWVSYCSILPSMYPVLNLVNQLHCR